jgi:hypothetical protein
VIDGACAAVFASKPAPTFDLCTQDQCGSGLAREGGKPGTEYLNDTLIPLR